MATIRTLYGMVNFCFLEFTASHFTGNKFICTCNSIEKVFYFVALLLRSHSNHRRRKKNYAQHRMWSHQQQLTKIKQKNNHFLSSNNHIKAIFMAIAISNGEGDWAPIHGTIFFYFIFIFSLRTLIMFALVRFLCTPISNSVWII